jgi:biopolymer transport protein ExbD
LGKLEEEMTMARPSGRGHVGEEGIGDPDLIPIMSIMCILIPMLIYSFVMYEVKVQEISLPKFGGPSSGGPSKVLNLAVIVGKDKHVIKIQGGGKEAKEIALKKQKRRLCDPAVSCDECAGPEFDDYDYAGLYKEVAKLKASDDFKEVDSINIGADNAVPWKVMAKTIDAVRSRMDKDSYGNFCEYDRAKPLKLKTTDADGNEITTAAEMFPKIVFVML